MNLAHLVPLAMVLVGAALLAHLALGEAEALRVAAELYGDR